MNICIHGYSLDLCPFCSQILTNYYYASEIEESAFTALLPKELEFMKGKTFEEIRRVIGTERFREILNYLYSELGMSTIIIARLLNVSSYTVGYWLRRLSIPIRPHKLKEYSRLGYEEKWQVEVINGQTVKTHVIVPNIDLVRIIFFAIGDGSVTQYCLQLFSSEKTLISIYQRRMGKYGAVYKDFWDKEGRKVEYLAEAYLCRLTLNNSEIARLIADHHGLRFDTIAFCLANKELARHGIASLWDADGSIPEDRTKKLGYRAEITQTHIPEIGKDAIRLLTYIGTALKHYWNIQTRLRSFKKGKISQHYKKPIKQEREKDTFYI